MEFFNFTAPCKTCNKCNQIYYILVTLIKRFTKQLCHLSAINNHLHTLPPLQKNLLQTTLILRTSKCKRCLKVIEALYIKQFQSFKDTPNIICQLAQLTLTSTQCNLEHKHKKICQQQILLKWLMNWLKPHETIIAMNSFYTLLVRKKKNCQDIKKK